MCPVKDGLPLAPPTFEIARFAVLPNRRHVPRDRPPASNLPGVVGLRSLEADPHINLSYYKDRTREWISVSGLATISRDRQKIRELYAPDWKMWFPNEGDARHGTPDDPRLVLIGVEIHGAVFLEVNKPQPVVLYELVKGWLTGTEPELGKMHTLTP